MNQKRIDVKVHALPCAYQITGMGTIFLMASFFYYMNYDFSATLIFFRSFYGHMPIFRDGVRL